MSEYYLFNFLKLKIKLLLFINDNYGLEILIKNI